MAPDEMTENQREVNKIIHVAMYGLLFRTCSHYVMPLFDGTVDVSCLRLTATRVLAGTKYSCPIGFYSRNSTKSTVNPKTTIPQI